jgi:hypothetical protein
MWGAGRMGEYRFYCLDEDGHIGLAEWIEADDDGDAIAKVRKARPDATKCEIWQKNRLVVGIDETGRIERRDEG